MNQPDGNSARDPQEAKEVERDGIVMCQACGERPASVTLALPSLGIVGVCGNCAGHLLVTALAESADDE
jgi:hypothetical protein